VNLTIPELQDSREAAKEKGFLRGLRGFASHSRFAWVLPLLIALPALVPLLRPGFFVSDDGLFHVYRIAALADAWEHGVLYPRLFPQFGFGYGQAVLNFYAPLSYAPGTLLALLGMSPAVAAEWTFALGFILASLAAYGMGRYLWGVAGGVLAAVLYTYFPYHLADVYVRGALPEHMAFAFLPLIVWCTVAAYREAHGAPAYLWLSLAWAGLVYTHNLTVLLMAPAWIVLALGLALATGRWRRFAGAVAGVILAVGLSAWVWLPFLAESGHVGIGLGPSDGYVRHLAPLGQLIQAAPLYGYRAAHGAGLAEHPLSWPAALFLLAIAGWLALRWATRRPAANAAVALYGLCLAAAAALMTAAPSLPAWRLLQPVLAQMQYPWRFMTLAALGLAIAAGALVAPLHAGSFDSVPARKRPGLRSGCLRFWPNQELPRRARGVRSVLVAIMALAFVVNGLALVPLEPLPITAAEAWGTARMWGEDAAAGQVGATWTGEFLPQTVTEQRWALGRPAEGAVDGPPLARMPDVEIESLGYDRVTLRFRADAPDQVRLHQFHLPAWRAYLDGRRADTYPSGELGLVTVDVPPGTARVLLRFGPTRAVMAAGLILALSALGWALAGWSRRWEMRRRDRVGMTAAAPLLVVLVAAIIANTAGLGVRTWTPQPLGSAVEDVAQLAGYDLARAKGEDALDVTLYWLASRQVGRNYKIFVHLLDAGGAVVAQHDGDPAGGHTPATRWQPAELIADTHRLSLPEGLSGTFELRAGMYEVRAGETPGFRNLAVDPATADGRIVLGTVTLPLRR